MKILIYSVSYHYISTDEVRTIMSTKYWNKIFMVFLLSILIAMGVSFIARLLVPETHIEELVYPLEIQPEQPVEQTSVPTGPEPIEGLLVQADVERGRKLARACLVCHSTDQSGVTMIGPSLWDVVGRNIAQAQGYAYSSTLRNRQQELWSYTALNSFLYNPRIYAPGTKMSYAGLRKTRDRADIIAWLRTLSLQPYPLP